jgi:hypothetical protein
MKQGQSSYNAPQMKREPIPHAIDPCAVEYMGNAAIEVHPPLRDGRGFKAPMNVAETSHKSGSQGKR